MMISSEHFAIILSENNGEDAMKVLTNIMLSVISIGFAAFCFVLLVGRFCEVSYHEDLLAPIASRFRNNAFLGLDDKELTSSFGSPLEIEVIEHVREEDFFWWPSFLREDTPWKRIVKDQKVRFLCFEDGDSLLHVCEILDSNGVWRVIGDVTPPNDIVF